MHIVQTVEEDVISWIDVKRKERKERKGLSLFLQLNFVHQLLFMVLVGVRGGSHREKLLSLSFSLEVSM